MSFYYACGCVHATLCTQIWLLREGTGLFGAENESTHSSVRPMTH